MTTWQHYNYHNDYIFNFCAQLWRTWFQIIQWMSTVNTESFATTWNTFLTVSTSDDSLFIFHSLAVLVFGHTAQLILGTPTCNALQGQVSPASGRSLGWDWRHWPGHPRARWTNQLQNDTEFVPANLWRQATVERCDGPSWLHDNSFIHSLKL